MDEKQEFLAQYGSTKHYNDAIQSNVRNIRHAAAKNIGLNHDVVLNLIHHDDGAISSGAASRSDLTQQMLHDALHHKTNSATRQTAAINPSLGSDLIYHSISHNDPHVRQAVLANDSITKEHLNYALKSNDKSVASTAYVFLRTHAN